MAHRDFRHRPVVDRRGTEPAAAAAFADYAWRTDAYPREQVLERVGLSPTGVNGRLRIVLDAAERSTVVVAELERWRKRLLPTGAIQLLTPTRGRDGYVDQNELTRAGEDARLVDSKACGVSSSASSMRGGIREEGRVHGAG